ncbi:alpha/beta hydrolase [Roseomonas sp. BU-1]|uniref:Alpha/beta hydrolase n=2 Tax=Falsiroseomonas selenitidurans TaxID=2716335 RepID=A0ABX1EAR3_9PROT|nr:alpha/beta hydrolase [Falsiroseomonas selenitidurans]
MGRGRVPVLLAHGYGCDQSIWRLLAPRLAEDFSVFLFDHVGAGGAAAPFDPQRHATLHGYAEDLLAICRALDQGPLVFIGHSVSASIGLLAAARAPALFSRLVLITPSPRYIDEGDYVGGFSAEDIEALLALLQADQQGWAAAMAPTIMGNPDQPELAAELEQRFCRLDPTVAVGFARATFTADNRADLPWVRTRTLLLQCQDDPIAPPAVGAYMRDRLPDAALVTLAATGHCPHLSAPAETAAAIRHFLRDLIGSDGR